MKHLLLLLLFMVNPIFSFGQSTIDIKTKPFSIFIGSLNFSSEFQIKEKFSIEPDFTAHLVSFSQFQALNNKGFSLNLQGKFYCIPESNNDKLYLGVYTKYKSRQDFTFNNVTRNQAIVGMVAGYKWLFPNRIILQVDLGFGRQIYEANYLDNLLQSTTSIPNQIDIFQFVRGQDVFIHSKIGYRLITK